ncbi:MAG: DM13 domain-containing protein [Pseudomonadota bacterium]
MTATPTPPADASLTRRGALRLVALGGTAALAGCAARGDGGAATAPAEPVVLGPDARVTARGSFVGKSDHVTTGHASVVFDEGKVLITLEDDFTFDGAPDPKVALGNGGYDAGTLLGPLQSNAGAQAYPLKAGLDIGDYFEVWIWCEKFNVPLGVAELTLT